MRKMMAVAGFVSCVLLGLDSHAQELDSPGDFALCDGFGAPNENGDGMTKEAAGFLRIFRMAAHAGDLTMNSPAFGTAGVKRCDSALSQARLAPQYHLRRASLLRARGIHRFGEGGYEQGVADLALADEEGRLASEPFYDRSFGVGNKLFRAYAMLKTGHKSEAAALTDEIIGQRPYSFMIQKTASILRVQATGDWSAYLRHMKSVSAVHSEARKPAFMLAFRQSDFETVAAIGPQLDFSPPKEWFGGYQIQQYELLNVKLRVEKFTFDTLTAIALSALGKDADGRAMIADLHSRFSTWEAPLPLLPDGRKPPKQQRLIHEGTQAMLPAMRRLLARAETQLDLMTAARQGDLDKIKTAFRSSSIGFDGMGLAIVRELRTHSKDASGEIERMKGAVEANIAATNETLPVVELSDLYDAIPVVETVDRLPKYKSAKNIIGENVGNGFILKTEGMVTHINFGGLTATSSTVEEMALLKAAEMALEKGHGRISILSKRIAPRSLHSYGMYGGGVMPMGYSADLDFVSFPSGTVLAGYEQYSTSSLSAQDVWDALSPIYRR